MSSDFPPFSFRDACLILYGMYWQMPFEDQRKYFGSEDIFFGLALLDAIAGVLAPKGAARLVRMIHHAEERGLDFPEGVIEAL